MRLAISCAVCCALAFAADNKTPVKKPPIKRATPQVPLGLLPIEWPAGNPYSPEKVELGRLLYFDKRLSQDDTISCASCHSPEHAYTDGAPNSTEVGGETSRQTMGWEYSLRLPVQWHRPDEFKPT